MWKIRRYVATTVLGSITLVTLALIGVAVIFNFVQAANSIGVGSYNIWQALLYVLLNIPATLATILPVASLLGCLIGLGLLSSHSELLVLRASGLAVRQIAEGVVIAALAVVIVSAVLGMYVGPKLARFAQIHQTVAKTGQMVLFGNNSTWFKDGDDYVHVRSVTPGPQLHGVVRYELDKKQLEQILTAQKAYYTAKGWRLEQVSQTTFSNDSAKQRAMPDITLHHLISPKLLKLISIDPTEMTLYELSSLIQYRQANGLSAGQFALQWWQILFQPISAIILMLIAVPFAFGPLRSSTQGLRIVAGVIIGFAFFTLNRFFGSYSIVHDISPFLGAALPSVVAFLVLIGLYTRV